MSETIRVGPGVVFSPTMHLRTVLRMKWLGDGPGQSVTRQQLQQAWRADDGTIEWRGVEVVKMGYCEYDDMIEAERNR